jgi:hypothetical protein
MENIMLSKEDNIEALLFKLEAEHDGLRTDERMLGLANVPDNDSRHQFLSLLRTGLCSNASAIDWEELRRLIPETDTLPWALWQRAAQHPEEDLGLLTQKSPRLARLFWADRAMRRILAHPYNERPKWAKHEHFGLIRHNERSMICVLAASEVVLLKRDPSVTTFSHPKILGTDEINTFGNILDILSKASISFLYFFPWYNPSEGGVVLAGGYLEYLCNKSRSNKVPDMDFFVVIPPHISGDLRVERANKIRAQWMLSLKEWHQDYLRSIDSSKIHVGQHCTEKTVGQYKFQLIHRIYETPAEVVHGFDLASSAMLFDGESIYMTPRCITAWTAATQIVDPERQSPSFEYRLRKKRLACMVLRPTTSSETTSPSQCGLPRLHHLYTSSNEPTTVIRRRGVDVSLSEHPLVSDYYSRNDSFLDGEEDLFEWITTNPGRQLTGSFHPTTFDWYSGTDAIEWDGECSRRMEKIVQVAVKWILKEEVPIQELKELGTITSLTIAMKLGFASLKNVGLDKLYRINDSIPWKRQKTTAPPLQPEVLQSILYVTRRLFVDKITRRMQLAILVAKGIERYERWLSEGVPIIPDSSWWTPPVHHQLLDAPRLFQECPICYEEAWCRQVGCCSELHAVCDTCTLAMLQVRTRPRCPLCRQSATNLRWIKGRKGTVDFKKWNVALRTAMYVQEASTLPVSTY